MERQKRKGGKMWMVENWILFNGNTSSQNIVF